MHSVMSGRPVKVSNANIILIIVFIYETLTVMYKTYMQNHSLVII